MHWTETDPACHLAGVLRDGARPMRYRTRIRELLGRSEPDGTLRPARPANAAAFPAERRSRRPSGITRADETPPSGGPARPIARAAHTGGEILRSAAAPPVVSRERIRNAAPMAFSEVPAAAPAEASPEAARRSWARADVPGGASSEHHRPDEAAAVSRPDGHRAAGRPDTAAASAGSSGRIMTEPAPEGPAEPVRALPVSRPAAGRGAAAEGDDAVRPADVEIPDMRRGAALDRDRAFRGEPPAHASAPRTVPRSRIDRHRPEPGERTGEANDASTAGRPASEPASGERRSSVAVPHRRRSSVPPASSVPPPSLRATEHHPSALSALSDGPDRSGRSGPPASRHARPSTAAAVRISSGPRGPAALAARLQIGRIGLRGPR